MAAMNPLAPSLGTGNHRTHRPHRCTRFSDIRFSAPDHSYIHAPTSTPLISATTILKSIKPEFDRDTIAARTAAKRGVSTESILAEWEQSSSRALANGSAVHAYAEDIVAGLDPSPVVELGNDHLPEVVGFKSAWVKMRQQFNAKVVRTETIVGDLSFGIAGTVDCLARLTFDRPGDGHRGFERTTTLHVFDWKTGKRFNSQNNFGEKLLPPFDDLDNCELSIYSLQTSIYRLILERNPNDLLCGGVDGGDYTDLPFGDSFLVYLPPDGGYYFYRGIDYRERVAEWLNWRLFR